MKIDNRISIETAALKLLQQNAILSQNAIKKISKVHRSTQTSSGLVRPEDFVRLLCTDKNITAWECEKLFEHARGEQSPEDYLLSVFKFTTGWTVDWQKNSTIWAIKPTANNSLFLQCLKSRIFFLAKAVLKTKFFSLKFEQPGRKAAGVIAILSGITELQWHILDLADSTKRGNKLYELYLSACKAIKYTVGKDLDFFFPADKLIITKFINEAISSYPKEYVFTKEILNGIKLQKEPI